MHGTESKNMTFYFNNYILCELATFTIYMCMLHTPSYMKVIYARCSAYASYILYATHMHL